MMGLRIRELLNMQTGHILMPSISSSSLQQYAGFQDYVQIWGQASLAERTQHSSWNFVLGTSNLLDFGVTY
jgi:hypothetical protein